MKWIHSLFSTKKRSSNYFFLFVILLGGCISTSSCSKKPYSVLKLKIENKKYEHLSLFATLNLPENYTNGWETAGVSTDGHKWTFIVADSINKITRRYFIRTKPFDFEKNEIPWRSLFARDYRNGLYKHYQIEGIPHSLLVHPNGKVEKIDVRYPLDKEKLYELIEEEK